MAEAVAGAAAVVADPVDTEEAAVVGISRPSVAVDTAIGVGAKEVVANGSTVVVAAAAAKEVTEVATAEVAAVVVVHGITTASTRRIRIGIAM